MNNKVVSRKKILELEKLLLNSNDEQVIDNGGEIMNCKEFPIKHSFADGIYVRQMDMQKDSVVIGAIHNHLHVWFLLTGKLTVTTETEQQDYIAPCYVVSQPGAKRLIYAHEDSIFINIHKNPTNTQNINELEKEIVSKNYKEYEQYINKNK
jgi:quercetin dioxygenase-like cupin family protein|tara:strand:- start:191 stop:646 length:456 start_codon:yes stop_codon:yes gene_type:complete